MVVAMEYVTGRHWVSSIGLPQFTEICSQLEGYVKKLRVNFAAFILPSLFHLWGTYQDHRFGRLPIGPFETLPFL